MTDQRWIYRERLDMTDLLRAVDCVPPDGELVISECDIYNYDGALLPLDPPRIRVEHCRIYGPHWQGPSYEGIGANLYRSESGTFYGIHGDGYEY